MEFTINNVGTKQLPINNALNQIFHNSTMKFYAEITLVAATAATLAQAATVNVCKGQGKTECIPVDAPAFICTNLVSAGKRKLRYIKPMKSNIDW